MNTPSERSIPLPSRMYNPNVCPGLLTISTKLVMASGSWKTKEKKHFLKKGEKYQNFGQFSWNFWKETMKENFSKWAISWSEKGVEKKSNWDQNLWILGERERGKNQSFPQKRPENGHWWSTWIIEELERSNVWRIINSLEHSQCSKHTLE